MLNNTRVDGCYRWTRCRPNLEPKLALNGGRKWKAAVITNTYTPYIQPPTLRHLSIALIEHYTIIHSLSYSC